MGTNIDFFVCQKLLIGNEMADCSGPSTYRAGRSMMGPGRSYIIDNKCYKDSPVGIVYAMIP